MIYPKLGVKIGAGKTPGIYHPVVGVLIIFIASILILLVERDYSVPRNPTFLIGGDNPNKYPVSERVNLFDFLFRLNKDI